jgi:D-serine deaminase-like pyridoxal phosphate-dependent protein
VSRLAKHVTLRVAVDSLEGAKRLGEAANRVSTTIGILVDLDVGMGRTGLQTSSEALKVAQFVDATAGLRLDGLFCYPGHIGRRPDEQSDLLQDVSDQLDETLRLWDAHGLQARIVSGGSTPTAFQSHLVPEYTEIRPGTYLYNDMNTVRGGYCSLDDCAARIHCTVVSTAVPGQVVIDGGSKTLTSDLCGPAPDSGYGFIVEYPQARITRLSEEHGQVDIRACAKAPVLGERVTVVPNHICPCVNLQDAVWWRSESGALEQLVIDARGKLT